MLENQKRGEKSERDVEREREREDFYGKFFKIKLTFLNLNILKKL